MGLFGTIGGLIGGQKAKKYAKKAKNAQLAAIEQAKPIISGQWDYTQGILDPYQQAGKTALGQYGDLLGLGGADAQAAAIMGVKESPFYQSLYRTGEESVLQNASATGGIRGGDTQHSLYTLGEDTLMKAIEHQMAGLGGMANMGFSGAGQLAGFGNDYASNMANLALGVGSTKANYYGQRAGLAMGTWKGLGSLADQAAAAAVGAGAGPGGAAFNFGNFLGNLYPQQGQG